MPLRTRFGSSSSSSPTSTGMSDSIPSTLIPLDRLSSIWASVGSPVFCADRAAARARTSGVSKISRHGGAVTDSTASSERWSMTPKVRMSVISSPKNSTRTGWSAVGGNTSSNPPRTAISPRFSTMSTRVYASDTSCSTTEERSTSSPTVNLTGAISPRCGAIGWIIDRMVATITDG